jgi:hypothetical protein
MRRSKTAVLGLGLVLLAGTGVAKAGCIGPVIMGECKGQDVPWDTHEPGTEHPDPPAGSYWDWRGTTEQQRYPENVNPFTGRDPNDSQWFDQGRAARNVPGWREAPGGPAGNSTGVPLIDVLSKVGRAIAGAFRQKFDEKYSDQLKAIDAMDDPDNKMKAINALRLEANKAGYSREDRASLVKRADDIIFDARKSGTPEGAARAAAYEQLLGRTTLYNAARAPRPPTRDEEDEQDDEEDE